MEQMDKHGEIHALIATLVQNFDRYRDEAAMAAWVPALEKFEINVLREAFHHFLVEAEKMPHLNRVLRECWRREGEVKRVDWGDTPEDLITEYNLFLEGSECYHWAGGRWNMMVVQHNHGVKLLVSVVREYGYRYARYLMDELKKTTPVHQDPPKSFNMVRHEELMRETHPPSQEGLEWGKQWIRFIKGEGPRPKDRFDAEGAEKPEPDKMPTPRDQVDHARSQMEVVTDDHAF